MPRRSGQGTDGLASDRLDQRPGLRGRRHELRALVMPPAKQLPPRDAYFGDETEVNDQSSIADYRRSTLPCLPQFAGAILG
jgi:hypothetical protein